MNSNIPEPYEAVIVPALQKMQHEHGYLKREEVVAFAKKRELPLYRVHAVASYFPHFRTTPPPAVTVRVCRDMACAMAGSREVIKVLGQLEGEAVHIEGVSCLGRCDRAPAACVTYQPAIHATTPGPEEMGNGKPASHAHAGGEWYYLGRSARELKEVINDLVAGKKPALRPDFDADQAYDAADWMIDPYKGKERDYEGVIKAVAARKASLRKAGDAAGAANGWSVERVELFHVAAALGRTDLMDEPMLKIFRDWQITDNWADVILEELGGKQERRSKDPAQKPADNPAEKPAQKPAEPDKRADLRGMGGGGMSAAQKWRDVRQTIRTARRRGTDDRGFIVVNGDESEPATFKDRELLLRTPHLVVEGVILAGLVTGASQGFIYIRHEYPEQIAACRKEIERAEALGVCGEEASVLGKPFPVSVFVSPGGYICGEQSALIEAMSDNRGEPRNMPPKLETNGLQQLPTLVSNVETYAWVPYIWLRGGSDYAALGQNGWKGRRFFSVCGDVKRPGVYEVPMGITLHDLINDDKYCQGIVGGKALKAFAPSGPSGGFLPATLTAEAGLPRKHTENGLWKKLAERREFSPAATELDILKMELELDLFRALSPTAALGAGLVVYAEGRNMAEQAVNSLEFFRNESCGKCVPCRIGSQKLAAIGVNLVNDRISAEEWKTLLPEINDLMPVIKNASICGLGRSVPVPLETALRFFKQDVAGKTTVEPVVAPEAKP